MRLTNSNHGHGKLKWSSSLSVTYFCGGKFNDVTYGILKYINIVIVLIKDCICMVHMYTWLFFGSRQSLWWNKECQF